MMITQTAFVSVLLYQNFPQHFFLGVDRVENEPLKVRLIFKLRDLIFTDLSRPRKESEDHCARALRRSIGEL